MKLLSKETYLIVRFLCNMLLVMGRLCKDVSG